MNFATRMTYTVHTCDAETCLGLQAAAKKGRKPLPGRRISHRSLKAAPRQSACCKPFCAESWSPPRSFPLASHPAQCRRYLGWPQGAELTTSRETTDFNPSIRIHITVTPKNLDIRVTLCANRSPTSKVDHISRIRLRAS